MSNDKKTTHDHVIGDSQMPKLDKTHNPKPAPVAPPPSREPPKSPPPSRHD
jgi:hypothetical protein